MTTMDKIDNLLGPLNPNRIAAASSPDPLKLIVFTATGAQGSSVALEGIKAGHKVWGVTRNVDGEKAKELAEQGVQLVRGNMKDAETYKPYLEGMDAAYINADYFSALSDGASPQEASKIEVEQVKTLVDACKASGVGHIVYSALDGFEEEEKQAPHFQSKAEVAKYIQATYTGPITHSNHSDSQSQSRSKRRHHHLHHTFLYTSYYWSNLFKSKFLKRHPDQENVGGWLIEIPLPDDVPLLGFAVEQTGVWVKNILANAKAWDGKSVPACSEHITLKQMADHLAELSGEKVSTLGMAKGKFHSEANKKELGEVGWRNWRMHVDQEFHRDVEQSRKLCPEQWTFEQWCSQSAELKTLFKKEEK